MRARRTRLVAMWGLTTLLAALFVLAGGGKLAATAQAVAEFRRFGYPSWFMSLVGAVEVAAGLALLVPGTARAGVVALLGIMAGAAWTHWRVGDPLTVPAVVALMLAALGWLRWRTPAGSPGAAGPQSPSGGG